MRSLARWARSGVPLIALLAVSAARSVAQSSDTVVTALGFVEHGDSGGWAILLPQPVTVASRRVGLLTASGNLAPYSKLQDRYVKAVGRLRLTADAAAFDATHVEEVQPEGTDRREIHPSFNQSAIITLSAIPNRFAWRLPDGQASGVQPLLMYTILNHGQSELDFLFQTNDVLCVEVRRQSGASSWQIALPAPNRSQERILIRLGGVYRQFVQIPPDAAPTPGAYIARVTLCGIADYVAETQLVIERP